MEKKYNSSEIINMVDKSFINFEERFKSEKSEQKINDDSNFDLIMTMIKFAIMSEIMSMLREEE